MQQAQTLAGQFNAASSALQQLRTSTTTQLGSVVSQVNSISSSLAALNTQIQSGTVAGVNVNTLLDQRDQLAQQLAQLTGATIQSGQNNMITVSLGGLNLVSASQSQKLVLDTSGPTAVLRAVQGGFVVNVTSGQAGGMLNDINTVIPNQLSAIDTVATTLRDQVNGAVSTIGGSIPATSLDQSAAGSLQFKVGVDGGAMQTVSVTGADWSGAGGATALQSALQTALDASVGAGNATATVTTNTDGSLSVSVTPTGTHALQVQAAGTNTGLATLLGNTPLGSDGIGGRAFFTGTNASNLAVSALIAGNPSAIAAGTASKGALDSSIAIRLGDAGASTSGADAAYNTMIVNLGTAAADVQTRDTIQQQSVTSLDATRNAQAGVNTDEEMTNMVEFQKAYEASAKFITALNSMLDTLLGMVGN
jgi:flagellar hook-associated protein 1 FlgK